MDAAQEIRSIRDQFGMTRREFAEVIGVSFIVIHSLESGQRYPRHDLMERIRQFRRSNVPPINPFIPIFDTEDRSGEAA